MTEEGAPNTVPPQPHELVLEKAYIDWRSTQTQMCAGFAAIVIVCVALYWPCITIPFGPDTTGPLNDALRALAGDESAYMTYMMGGYHDGVSGFRPVFYLLLMIEVVFFRAAPAGYHIVNILLLCGACALLSLNVLEVTGRYGNRLGACPAIWAGLLYAVYPLNSTLITELEGFQILLGSCFSLLTLFCFLRYRLIREWGYRVAALTSFVLAVLTWESSILLPLVLTASFLLPSEPPVASTRGARLKRIASFTGPYWAFAVMYALPRPEWLQSTLKTAFQGPLPDLNELAKTVWKMILYPPDQFAVPTVAALAIAAALIIVRMVIAQASFNALVFILVWLLIYLLQPNPNWTDAMIPPMCALLVLLALPAVDRMGKALSALYATAGSQLLLILLCYWAFKMLNPTP